jgi:REP element-mobilizing transposase RayT
MKYHIYIQDSAMDDIRELEGELSEGHLNAGIRKDDRRSQHRGCHQNGARAGSWSQFRGTGLRYCYRRGVRDRATPSISSMGILDFLAGLSARTPEPQMKYLLDRQTNDDQDRELMLRTLGQACAKTGGGFRAWVLMSNHYHWLMETPQPNLVEGMRWVQNIYTRRFNHRHKLLGHVFGGRYKAVLVEEEIKRTVARRRSWSSSLAEKSFIRNTALRAA